jgi:hypothetical protein
MGFSCSLERVREDSICLSYLRVAVDYNPLGCKSKLPSPTLFTYSEIPNNSMPDISMCMNETCPLRKGCYRFTATPDEYRQSYAMFEPYSISTKHGDIEETTHNCLHLMPNADFMRNYPK